MSRKIQVPDITGKTHPTNAEILALAALEAKFSMKRTPDWPIECWMVFFYPLTGLYELQETSLAHATERFQAESGRIVANTYRIIGVIGAQFTPQAGVTLMQRKDDWEPTCAFHSDDTNHQE